MNKQSKQRMSAFRFRRFARAGWAAFRSMHREVTIGRLDSRTADSSLRKGAAAVVLCAVMAPATLAAQSDDDRETRTLPEVTIAVAADTMQALSEPAAVFTANDFNQTSVHTVGDLVRMLPGVDVRSRGVGDVQGDISMRGGTFDQMVVLLNGVNITDIQTGHHNLDLPIDLSMVERIELLTPAQLMARGIAAFCGGVNIVVSDTYAGRLLAELGIGSHGTLHGAVLVGGAAGPWAVSAAAAYSRSDGYMANTDYRFGSLMLQATRHTNRDDWHLQLGGQMKGFGSQAFYSTTYPDQYEATRTLTASASNIHRSGSLRVATTLYGRLHSDRFELFREGYAGPAVWYTGHNHHLASSQGLNTRAAWHLGPGELTAGIDLRRDGIRSNVLGVEDSTLPAPYTKASSRLGATLFAGYALHAGPWQAEAVVLGNLNNIFGTNHGYAVAATRRIGTNWHVVASVCHSYRLPTFTDLYYQSVNQRANPDLNAESSLSAEGGIAYRSRTFTLRGAAYYRSGSQIIDWVRRVDDEVWYSMNHTAVDAYGADVAFSYRPDMVLQPTFGGSYSYCTTVQDAGQWISGSALDYLKHKALLYLAVQPVSGLTLKVDAIYRWREGQYVGADGAVHGYGGALLAGAAVEYQLRRCVIYAELHNLGDVCYRDHGGVPQPGRTLSAGVRYR